jgi:hypothetical protein
VTNNRGRCKIPARAYFGQRIRIIRVIRIRIASAGNHNEYGATSEDITDKILAARMPRMLRMPFRRFLKPSVPNVAEGHQLIHSGSATQDDQQRQDGLVTSRVPAIL